MLLPGALHDTLASALRCALASKRLPCVALVLFLALGWASAGFSQSPTAGIALGDQALAETSPAGASAISDLLGWPGGSSSLRASGWLDMGYTYASTASGRLAAAPEMNRFGNEFLLNQFALVLERPLARDDWAWGFYTQLFNGADAYTLQGPGDIQNTNQHFGASLHQVNLQAHLPILSDGGVDLVFGRQGSLMGYESYMAPLRPFYSLSYQWYFAEDGADTGCWATWHAAPDWDFTYGTCLGSNTLFTLRGDAPSHVLQLRQWLDREHKLYHAGTLIVGDQAVGKTIAFLPGTLAAVVEYRIQYAASDRLTQVVQGNIGADQDVRFIGTGRWYGLLTNSVYRLDERLDAQLRLEWFDDEDGTRTGRATDYVAVTSGLAARLTPRLTLRPELRGDFAGKPIYGRLDSLHRERNQLTAAVECVWTF